MSRHACALFWERGVSGTSGDDIAAAASFFCSEEAGFVSGQVLYVAGGPQD